MDDRCVQNLAVYLTKHEVRALGKPAIVARMPVLRSINQLMYEEQFKDGDIVVIGISDANELLDLPDLKSVKEYVAEESRWPSPPRKQAEVDKLDKMTREERWKYWIEEPRTASNATPAGPAAPCATARAAPWSATSPSGSACRRTSWATWNGTSCGPCTWPGAASTAGNAPRACPVKIPLNLLNQRIIADIAGNFGEEEEYALAAFKPNDKEEFIR